MDKLQTHTQSHTLEGFTPVISGTGPGTGTGAPHPTLHIRESDRHSRVIGECCTSRLSHRWGLAVRYAGYGYTYLYKRCQTSERGVVRCLYARCAVGVAVRRGWGNFIYTWGDCKYRVPLACPGWRAAR